jgi:hypothetical protein
MEVRLIVAPDRVTETPRLESSLLKAIVRAHEWYEWVLDGEAKDKASIARRTGLSERYVGKVFQCAFLAPDIVDSILAGSQPPGLTFDKLCRSLPMSWVEQRRQLGFSPRHPE